MATTQSMSLLRLVWKYDLRLDNNGNGMTAAQAQC
jgi:hypothetical protein